VMGLEPNQMVGLEARASGDQRRGCKSIFRR
jgi:hypothetical protein